MVSITMLSASSACQPSLCPPRYAITPPSSYLLHHPSLYLHSIIMMPAWRAFLPVLLVFSAFTFASRGCLIHILYILFLGSATLEITASFCTHLSPFAIHPLPLALILDQASFIDRLETATFASEGNGRCAQAAAEATQRGIQELSSRLSAAEKQLHHSCARLAAEEEHSSSLSMRLRDSDKGLAASTEALEHTRAELAAVTQKLNSLLSNTRADKRALSQARKKVDAYAQTIAEMSYERDEDKAKTDARVEALERELASTEEALACAAKGIVAAQQAMCNKLKEASDREQAGLRARDAEIESLREALDAARKTRDLHTAVSRPSVSITIPATNASHCTGASSLPPTQAPLVSPTSPSSVISPPPSYEDHTSYFSRLHPSKFSVGKPSSKAFWSRSARSISASLRLRRSSGRSSMRKTS